MQQCSQLLQMHAAASDDIRMLDSDLGAMQSSSAAIASSCLATRESLLILTIVI